jgi:DNA ligase 1
MLLKELIETSQHVAATSSRTTKISRIAELLKHAAPAEVPVVVAFLSGELRQRKTNVGWATMQSAIAGSTPDESTLSILDVDDTFERIANVQTGTGSSRERERLLRELLARATAHEREFIMRLVVGELRQGALEGIMLDAVARAAGIPAADVRRAHMLSGNLTIVADAALQGGAPALASFGIQLFRPLQPMLAQSADDVNDALQRLGTAALEYKLDGARIQVHRQDAEVRIYSRNLNDVTDAVPELVDVVRGLRARELVLDGEVIAIKADGRPHDFQMTMKRFGSRRDVARLRAELPVRPFFFDCLYMDGRTLIDLPAADRFSALYHAVGEEWLAPRTVTDDVDRAQSFLQASLNAGHEGLVAKALDAPYEAGRRGASWIKIKVAKTLDLVVLAAEWGHGRRHGKLSNLHLGARDAVNGGFIMLGKTFKGMTDELLEWQTRELLAREVSRDGITVQVEPNMVVEIAYDDLQASPRYPGGLALRFARVKGYRPDKRADEADTIETVRALYEGRRTG